MAKSNAVTIGSAWNAVALEDRLELISRAQADGLLASIMCALLLGTVAYGFDKIWLLSCGLGLSFFFVLPIFMNYSWRKNQPALVLAYLAARAVARRYAFGYRFSDLSVVLIYRGTMREIFASKEAEEMHKQSQVVDFENSYQAEKEVWICLLRGGLVVISERRGGAKLEFISPISLDLVCRKPKTNEDPDESAIVIEGSASSRGRTVILKSPAVGAQYVFERQLLALVAEFRAYIEQMNRRDRAAISMN